MRWSDWIGFGASVFPLVGAAGIATWVSASYLSTHFSEGLMLPMILLAVLTYLGIQVTSETPLVAASLLLMLGALVGGIAARFFPGSGNVMWGRAVLITLGLLLCSFALSHVADGLVSVSINLLWLGSWVYLLGWAAIALLQPHNLIYKGWALLGAVVFTGLAAGWFARVDGVDIKKTADYATSLYLIGVNMVIAIVLGIGLTV